MPGRYDLNGELADGASLRAAGHHDGDRVRAGPQGLSLQPPVKRNLVHARVPADPLPADDDAAVTNDELDAAAATEPEPEDGAALARIAIERKMRSRRSDTL